MSPFLQLLLLLAVIIAVSKLAGHVSRRFGQPVVFGEILVGLLLGPTVLNLLGWPVFAGSPSVTIGGHTQTLLAVEVEVLAHIGVLLLMFVAGMETDLARLRAVGRPAVQAAVGGVLLPLVAGVGVSRAFGLGWGESIFIGAVLTATSVSITAQTLMELGRFRTREGTATMGAAVIDDVLGIIVLSLVIAFAGVQSHADGVRLPDLLASLVAQPGAPGYAAWQIVGVLVLMAGFFVVAVAAARRFSSVLRIADRLHASHAIPAAALVLMLLYAVGAEFVGQVAAITGAYIAGVFLARTPWKTEIEHAIHPFTYALFVPIFFMSIGLSTQVVGGNLWFILALVVVAMLTKVVGCGLGARWAGFTAPESLRVGVGMISRGEVGLIVAQVGLTAGIVRGANYGALVIVVLVSTIITPLLLRYTFRPGRAEAGEVYESVAALETDDDAIQAE